MEKLLAIGRRLALACVTVLVVACGGGGGDAPAAETPPPEPAFTGTWTLSLAIEGDTSAPVAVPASAVPTATQVSQMTTASVAQLFASNTFQGMTVTVANSTATVTGPGTNYALVINSFQSAGYQGCGSCAAGSQVSFNVTMNYSESGVFQGEAVPANNDSVTITFRYTRTS